MAASENANSIMQTWSVYHCRPFLGCLDCQTHSLPCLPRCADLMKCPHHQQAKPGTVWTQALLSVAAHAVVQYMLNHCCLLLHMQWYSMHSSTAVFCCTCSVASLHTTAESSRTQPALTLVVKARSSLAFTGEVHVKLSKVCMKTPAGSVTVCPPLSPEFPSTELTKHNAPSKFG